MTLLCNKRLMLQVMLSCLLGLWGAISYAQNGTTNQKTKLMIEPYRDASVVLTIPKGGNVILLKRKGGWSQVEYDGNNGWIRTMKLSFGKSAADSSISSVAGLATGRSGSGNVVATTGIRGLDEEDLKSARFDEKQIARAESYQSSSKKAKKFASKAGLKAQNISYLKAASANDNPSNNSVWGDF